MRKEIMCSLGLLTIFWTALAGDIGSIGVIVIDRETSDKPLRIGNVVPGSPAERSGIKAQSRLISVDGTNVTTMSLLESVRRVTGQVGTSVTLEIADEALTRTNKFTVKRGKMVISGDKREFVE